MVTVMSKSGVTNLFFYLFQFARQFYIGQWYRDCTMEVEKATKAAQNKSGDSENDLAEEMDKVKEVQAEVERRKVFLLAQMKGHIGAFATFKYDCAACEIIWHYRIYYYKHLGCLENELS